MSSDARLVRQFAELIRAGHLLEPDFQHLSPQVVPGVSYLLSITKKVGGPLATTLDRYSEVLVKRTQMNSELELAVAGPKASTRLVLSLPLLVFVGSGIAGIPILRTFQNSWLVWVSFILGLFLFWLGSRWTNRLIKRSEPRTLDPGLPCEALAIAVSAGLPLAEASALVENAPELTELQISSGVALVQLLRDRADAARQEQFNADRLKIQKTSIKVLWPLGLTVLPAFVLLAIVPVGAALIENQ